MHLSTHDFLHKSSLIVLTFYEYVYLRGQFSSLFSGGNESQIGLNPFSLDEIVQLTYDRIFIFIIITFFFLLCVFCERQGWE